MAPIHFIRFEYLAPEQDEFLSDSEKLKVSLKEIEKWSNIIGAAYLPEYDDPTKLKEIQNFTKKTLKDYSLKNRFKRFFTGEKEPRIDMAIILKGSSVVLDKSTSSKAWRDSLLRVLTDISPKKVRLCIWSSEWNTFDCYLYLSHSAGRIKINGYLSSMEAYDDKNLQTKMSNSMRLLFENGGFKGVNKI